MNQIQTAQAPNMNNMNQCPRGNWQNSNMGGNMPCKKNGLDMCGGGGGCRCAGCPGAGCGGAGGATPWQGMGGGAGGGAQGASYWQGMGGGPCAGGPCQRPMGGAPCAQGGPCAQGMPGRCVCGGGGAPMHAPPQWEM